MALTLAAALKNHPPENLARYLWASLVYIPFIWAAHVAWDDWDWRYAATYCLFTAAILYCVCRIAWDCVRDRRYRLRPIAICFILAAVLTKLAKLDLHGQWGWISLAEGFLLLWAGILVAFSGAWRPRWDLYVPLGIFWVLQGGYSLGWAIHGKLWESINWLVPPAMGCLCFSWLAWRLRWPSEHPVRRQSC